jgi:hypothetical protein
MAVIPFSVSLDEEFAGHTFGAILVDRGYKCPFNDEVIRELKDTASLPVYHHGNKYYVNMSLENYMNPKAGPYFLVPAGQKIVPAPVKETVVNSIPLVYTQEHRLRGDIFRDLVERAGYDFYAYKDDILCVKNGIKYRLETKWDSYPRVGTYWLTEVKGPETYSVNFKDLSNSDKTVYYKGNKVTLNHDGVPSTSIGLWETVEVPLRDCEVYVEIPYTYMHETKVDIIKAAVIKAGYTIYQRNYYFCKKGNDYYAIVRTYPTGLVLKRN